ncbi:CopG family ribbon-helix-helix protein [Arvimicrobium flavum]|uniref:CopG family ribbon-helix-helix protein n=1 Tax=Arvimicrobium flavum TaxID=3393320 RepID=UPI00237AB94C|nr:hypothetical protein [Mesorhizobium shangrilense]
MGEMPLSLRLDAETVEGLKREAALQDVALDDIASQAIKSYLDCQERERLLIQQRTVEADKGVFISSEAMMRWVEDLFDGKRTPPPQPDVFLTPRNR